MKGPVFIVGCPRSGTSFLYHLMLSAGGFAEFRTQMNVYDVLEPIYGDLRVLANRRRMMKDWLQSKAFAVSGLEAGEIEKKVLAECQDGSGFLRLVMESVATRQGVGVVLHQQHARMDAPVAMGQAKQFASSWSLLEVDRQQSPSRWQITWRCLQRSQVRNAGEQSTSKLERTRQVSRSRP